MKAKTREFAHYIEDTLKGPRLGRAAATLCVDRYVMVGLWTELVLEAARMGQNWTFSDIEGQPVRQDILATLVGYDIESPKFEKMLQELERNKLLTKLGAHHGLYRLRRR